MTACRYSFALRQCCFRPLKRYGWLVCSVLDHPATLGSLVREVSAGLVGGVAAVIVSKIRADGSRGWNASIRPTHCWRPRRRCCWIPAWPSSPSRTSSTTSTSPLRRFMISGGARCATPPRIKCRFDTAGMLPGTLTCTGLYWTVSPCRNTGSRPQRPDTVRDSGILAR